MARGRFVRVRDPLTRHEFDRRADDPAVVRGRFVRVKPQTYPPSPLPRRPKHHLDLAGLSASREPAPPHARPAVPEATAEGDEDRG